MGRPPKYPPKLRDDVAGQQAILNTLGFKVDKVPDPVESFRSVNLSYYDTWNLKNWRRGAIVMTEEGERRGHHLDPRHLGGPKNIIRICWKPVNGFTLADMRERVVVLSKGIYTIEQCHVTTASLKDIWFRIDESEPYVWLAQMQKIKRELEDMASNEFEERADELGSNLVAIYSSLKTLS